MGLLYRDIGLIQVEFDDETGYPTDRLNPTALASCKSLGSSAKTVSDILVGGDGKVLRMIQKGVDDINQQVSCKAHRVSPFLDASVSGSR